MTRELELEVLLAESREQNRLLQESVAKLEAGKKKDDERLIWAASKIAATRERERALLKALRGYVDWIVDDGGPQRTAALAAIDQSETEDFKGWEPTPGHCHRCGIEIPEEEKENDPDPSYCAYCIHMMEKDD